MEELEGLPEHNPLNTVHYTIPIIQQEVGGTQHAVMMQAGLGHTLSSGFCFYVFLAFTSSTSRIPPF